MSIRKVGGNVTRVWAVRRAGASRRPVPRWVRHVLRRCVASLRRSCWLCPALVNRALGPCVDQVLVRSASHRMWLESRACLRLTCCLRCHGSDAEDRGLFSLDAQFAASCMSLYKDAMHDASSVNQTCRHRSCSPDWRTRDGDTRLRSVSHRKCPTSLGTRTSRSGGSGSHGILLLHFQVCALPNLSRAHIGLVQ